MYQASGGRGASMMRDTLSVMRAKALSPRSGELNGLVLAVDIVSLHLGGRVMGSSRFGRRQVGMRVRDARQVVHARPIVELLQQLVGARHAVGGGNAALLVVQVAEDDRAGRARLFAGHLNLAVHDGPLSVLAPD